MIKKTMVLSICIAVMSFLQVAKAQSAQKWKEMEAFHQVLSKTFHPAEEGNVKPAKDSASLLLQRAELWQQAAIPAGYKPDLTKSVLTKLVASCKDLETAVKQGKSDDVIKAKITKVHDDFHEIAEKCREPHS
jgi:hypothetical protein